MLLTEAEYNKTLQQYEYLRNLITERRQFEATHLDPYKKPYPATDLNFPTLNGMTLFHLAVKLGDTKRVAQLLQEMSADEKGKIINHTTSSVASPMLLALYYDNTDMAQLLMKEGANVFTLHRHFLNESPEGLRFYDAQIKKQLKQAVASNQALNKPLSVYSLYSALDFAAIVGDIETLRHIEPSQAGMQLQLAITNNQFETFKYLLDRGADVNSSDEHKRSCLHLAAMNDRVEMIEALLKHGANIDARDKRGEPPLFYSAQNSNKKSFKQLYRAGANAFAKNNIGETIYHVATKCGFDEELDQIILELNPDKTDATKISLKALKDELTIFDETVAAYKEMHMDKSVAINQNALLPQIKYYFLLKRRNAEFMTWEGVCSALSFLHEYYASIDDPDRIYQILQTLVAWDGTESGLQQKPKPPLDYLYNKVEDIFEEILEHIVFIQSADAVIPGLKQDERDLLMKCMGKPNAINYLLSEIRVIVNSLQLSEIFDIIRCYPANTHIDIAIDKHAKAARLNTRGEYQYYDSNRPQRLKQNHSHTALVNRIFDRQLEEGPDPKNLVYVRAYRFTWEPPIKDVFKPYLQETQIPKSKEDVDTYVANSPCGLNQLFVAILSQDVRALDQLLDLDYFDINKKNDILGLTLYELIYKTHNPRLYELFLKRKKTPFDTSDDVLCDAYYHDKRFIETIINHPCSKHLDRILIEAAKEDNTETIKKLLQMHKVDKNNQTTCEKIIGYIFSDVGIKDETKYLIYDFFKNANLNNGNSLLHLRGYIYNLNEIAVGFLLKCDPDLINKKNSMGVTPLENFVTSISKEPTPISPNEKEILSVYLQFLPKNMSFTTGCNILELLHRLNDPLRTTHAKSVCAAMDKTREHGSQTFFQFDLLRDFVLKFDDVIVKALLNSDFDLKINQNNNENKYTALHYALMQKPGNADQRKANHEIISALIQAGADLDIKASNGVTCRELIQMHPDSDMLVNKQASLLNHPKS